ncbi:MAG: hypothetical protein LIP12_02150 [Clostridiales bacterium]|nr:hypothetical protein [Clostridiales bacterium]
MEGKVPYAITKRAILYTFEDTIKVGIFDDLTIDFTEVMSDIPMEE